MGNAAAFNSLGAVPTNTTQKDVLRTEWENDWHNAPAIRLLAALAALLHDMGKANDTFQAKLKPSNKRPLADPFRHEWVSLRILQALVGGAKDDREWLTRLFDPPESWYPEWLNRLITDPVKSLRDPLPWKTIPPLAQAVGWLMVSHHRMPGLKPDDASPRQLEKQPESISPDWCGSNYRTDGLNAVELKKKQKAIKGCWSFKNPPPFGSPLWRKRIKRTARMALECPGFVQTGWLDNPQVMHLARMALMMADHHYSSLSNPRERIKLGRDHDCLLYANNTKDYESQTWRYNQWLDEHLVGVERHSASIVHALPDIERRLPRIARHRWFSKRSKLSPFRWQDKAYDLSCSLRQSSTEHGFFGVNLASTGCGKTLGNGRIMYALADPQKGARFTLALGLRTLTLQTGEAYSERLGLGPDDLAVLVGGQAVQELRALDQDVKCNLAGNKLQAESETASGGSESAEDLMDPLSYVYYEGSLPSGPLTKWLKKNPRANKLINAPILVCTIDHMVPATESLRGGRQIAPMLRLMSSDLVLDEPDDFDLDDLHALSRLVHWAGMLGCRVLLSSATMPPSMVRGMFEAYLAGRENYQQNRGEPGTALNVCCAWFDEFGCQAAQHSSGDEFEVVHHKWVAKRIERLQNRYTVRRRGRIVGFHSGDETEEPEALFARSIAEQSLALHAKHHSVDPYSGKKVSFGLARMANIVPLIKVTRELAAQKPPEDTRIYLCVYHSQHPLLVRSAIENRLDRLLKRKAPDAVFYDPELRASLDRHDEQNQIFMVLATPVAEVGRDHDYDWSIVEPSSMRSIIQLAGRVRRHRPEEIKEPNLYLLKTNFKELKGGSRDGVFNRPGFENQVFYLNSHDLHDLLEPEQYSIISSAPRIVAPAGLNSHDNLAALEHAHIKARMLGDAQNSTAQVNWFWTPRATLSGNLQIKYPFRKRRPQNTYCFVFDEDSEKEVFSLLAPRAEPVPSENLLSQEELELAQGVSLWGGTDYLKLLEDLAAKLELDIERASRRFGTIELYRDEAQKGWKRHTALGVWMER